MKQSIIKSFIQKEKQELNSLKIKKVYCTKSFVTKEIGLHDLNTLFDCCHSLFVSYKDVEFFIPLDVFDLHAKAISELGVNQSTYLNYFNNFFTQVLRYNQFNLKILDIFNIDSYYIRPNSFYSGRVKTTKRSELIQEIQFILKTQLLEIIENIDNNKDKIAYITMNKGWHNGVFRYTDNCERLKSVYFQRIKGDMFAFRPMYQPRWKTKGSFNLWRGLIHALGADYPIVYFGVALGLAGLYNCLLEGSVNCTVLALGNIVEDELSLFSNIINSVSSSPKECNDTFDEDYKSFLEFNKDKNTVPVRAIRDRDLGCNVEKILDQRNIDILHRYKFQCFTGVAPYEYINAQNVVAKNFYDLFIPRRGIKLNDNHYITCFTCPADLNKDLCNFKLYETENLLDYDKYNVYYNFILDLDKFEFPIIKDRDKVHDAIEIHDKRVMSNKISPIKSRFLKTKILDSNYGHLFQLMRDVSPSEVKKEMQIVRAEFKKKLALYKLPMISHTNLYADKDVAKADFVILLASIMSLCEKKEFLQLPIYLQTGGRCFLDLFFGFYLRFCVNYYYLHNYETLHKCMIDSMINKFLSYEECIPLEGIIVRLIQAAAIQKETDENLLLILPSNNDLLVKQLLEFKNHIFSYRGELFLPIIHIYEIYTKLYGVASKGKLDKLSTDTKELIYSRLRLRGLKVEKIVSKTANNKKIYVKSVKAKSNYMTQSFEAIKLPEDRKSYIISKLNQAHELTSYEYKYSYYFKYSKYYFESWNIKDYWEKGIEPNFIEKDVI